MSVFPRDDLNVYCIVEWYCCMRVL